MVDTRIDLPDRATEPRTAKQGLIFVALLGAILAYTFAQAIVAPAVPVIQTHLGSSVSQTALLITVFLAVASVVSPIAGALGEAIGKKPVLLFTLAALAVGLLISALGSDSMIWLIVGRAIQGVAAGSFPLAFSMIREEFPPARVPMMLGAVSAGFGIGGGAGAVAAGVIIDQLGYAWIFWIGLILTIPIAALAWLWLPRPHGGRPLSIDWPGVLLLIGWSSGVLFGLSQGDSWGWGSPGVLILFGIAVILLPTWIWYGFRASSPMVDMRIMSNRTVFSVNIVNLFTGFGLFASFLLIPQLVQTASAAGYGFGASATEAGLFLLPQSLAVVVGSTVGGQLGGRFGSRSPLIVGCLLCAAAFVLLAVAHDGSLSIYLSSGVLGLGLGLVFAATPNLIVAAVEPPQIGVSTGMNVVFRTMGSALGGQVVASILASQTQPGAAVPTESRFVIAFVTAAVVLALAAVFAAFAGGTARASTT